MKRVAVTTTRKHRATMRVPVRALAGQEETQKQQVPRLIMK